MGSHSQRYFRSLTVMLAFRQLDTTLKKICRCCSGRRVRDFVKLRRLQSPPRRGKIAIDHRYVPLARRYRAIRIDSCRHLAKQGFERARVALPPEIDVATLDLRH